MTVKNWIWDLDGTLLDSYGSIVSSLMLLNGERGISDSEEEVIKAVKRGSVSAYLRGLSERYGESAEELFRRYQQISHRNLETITLMPGAIETLRGLRNAGALHFVYTHRGQSTFGVLERLELMPYFTEIVTFENGFKPKPSGEGVAYLAKKHRMDPAQTAYVGDRTLDVYCAKDAGVQAILFLPPDSCVIPTGLEDRIVKSLGELCESGNGKGAGFAGRPSHL